MIYWYTFCLGDVLLYCMEQTCWVMVTFFPGFLCDFLICVELFEGGFVLVPFSVGISFLMHVLMWCLIILVMFSCVISSHW